MRHLSSILTKNGKTFDQFNDELHLFGDSLKAYLRSLGAIGLAMRRVAAVLAVGPQR